MSRKRKIIQLERLALEKLQSASGKINKAARLIRDHMDLKVAYDGLACVCRPEHGDRPYSTICHLDLDLNAIHCDENITIVRKRIGCDRTRDARLAYVRIICKKSKAGSIVDKYFLNKNLSSTKKKTKGKHHGLR